MQSKCRHWCRFQKAPKIHFPLCNGSSPHRKNCLQMFNQMIQIFAKAAGVLEGKKLWWSGLVFEGVLFSWVELGWEVVFEWDVFGGHGCKLGRPCHLQQRKSSWQSPPSPEIGPSCFKRLFCNNQLFCEIRIFLVLFLMYKL